MGSRAFMQDSGEFLLDLELRNIQTEFEEEIQLAKDSRIGDRYETSYFAFGGFDWNLTVEPYGNEFDERLLICPTRQTSFDHLCKLRYLFMQLEDRLILYLPPTKISYLLIKISSFFT